MQAPGGVIPVEATVFRRAATDPGRLAFILRALFDFAIADRGQRLSQQVRRRSAEFTMQGQRRLILADSYAFLRYDIPGIGAAHHAVQRHASFAFAVDQHPVQRRAAAVFRQQGTMQVKSPLRRDIQNVLAQQIAVIEREQHVRFYLAETFDPQRMIHIFRRPYRNTLFRGNARHRAKEMVFARVIRMGKNGGDVITGIQQRLNTCTTHIVISEDYGFHERSSS